MLPGAGSTKISIRSLCPAVLYTCEKGEDLLVMSLSWVLYYCCFLQINLVLQTTGYSAQENIYSRSNSLTVSTHLDVYAANRGVQVILVMVQCYYTISYRPLCIVISWKILHRSCNPGDQLWLIYPDLKDHKLWTAG